MDSETAQVIPFNDIAPDAFVRWTSINEKQYLSVRDIIMCVCTKNSNYAGQVWRNLSYVNKEELSSYLEYYKFPGQGQSPQPVITFRGALKLIMFLPGEDAKKHRSAIAVILQRYYAGDDSLVDEIRANAESAKPFHQMARASLDYWDETEICIKKARIAMHDLGEQSNSLYRDVQGAVSGMERIKELKKEMYAIDRDERDQQRQHSQDERERQKQHVIDMAHVQVQAMKIISQATPSVPVLEIPQDCKLVGCKEWVTKFLSGKGITKGNVCASIYLRLQYRIKNHPSIQVIRKKGTLYFKDTDLKAVENIIETGINHLGWPAVKECPVIM